MECERDQHSGGVGETQNAQETTPFICFTILEPFSHTAHIQNFKVQLSMDNAISNYNGKIWVFWSSDIDCNILDEDE